MMRRPVRAARSTSDAGASVPSEAVVWRWRSITASGARAVPGLASRLPAAALAFDEQTVLADEQIEMRPLLVGELEEKALPFGVLESLPVALEELVRAALAADADHQRLTIVDALVQLIGAGGEQSVRRALEKEERRPRLELRILLEELAVPRFERREMRLLFLGELLEHAAAARIARNARRARIELEAAALRRDRDAERIAREQQLRRSTFCSRRSSGPARFARAVDLQHALTRREVAGRRHFLDERFDVGAEELEAAIAALADQMEMARMPVRVLEPEASFAEVHLPRDARVDHPLQRAINRRTADPLIFAADQIDEIICGEMSFLAEEDVDDEIALARPLAAGRAKTLDERSRRGIHRHRDKLSGEGSDPDRGRHDRDPRACRLLHAEGRAAAAGRLRVRVLDREAAAGDVVDEIDLGAAQVPGADRIDEQLDAVRFDHGISRLVPFAFVDHQTVLKA